MERVYFINTIADVKQYLFFVFLYRDRDHFVILIFTIFKLILIKEIKFVKTIELLNYGYGKQIDSNYYHYEEEEEEEEHNADDDDDDDLFYYDYEDDYFYDDL